MNPRVSIFVSSLQVMLCLLVVMVQAGIAGTEADLSSLRGNHRCKDITVKTTAPQIDPVKLTQFKSKLRRATADEVDDILERIANMSDQEKLARIAAFEASITKSDPQFKSQIDAAINPRDYQCDTSSLPLRSYIAGLTKGWGFVEQIYYSFFGNIPAYAELLFDNDASNSYFGTNGEYTIPVTHTFRDLKRFWNINSTDILLLDMHFPGVWNDPDLVGRTYVAMLVNFDVGPGNGTANGQTIINSLKPYFETTMGRENGAIWTFNAFAFTSNGQPIGFNLGVIPDKIVIGDGMLQGFETMGLGDIAPKAILAHEFGHHIQYENNLFATTLTDPAEKTRRTELMADAFAAYFLTHKRGLALNKFRVQQFLEAFYTIGDCGFTSSGHHGTPNQRRRAAQFGFDVANDAQKQGHILSSQEFAARFEAALPTIVAPDAP